ncbi:hypothetical protein BS78_03G056400 [Paspalum vaginatum]|uniref:Rapid alkalinization factor 1 n=1 Tax=Paspalum vaginatum TaxID=158149 RepID=A0A9W8CEP2_9POAL|nr:hypothetical protein BS78_K307600 [Paspalum vaginatum]KAJ1282493.1 hypothetical protein BS78_03G056400 [Paspalum vaginatum]
MEKVKTTRLAMAAVAVLCLLLAAGQAAGAEAVETMKYPHLSCEVLGNCNKKGGPEATRPGKAANKYTRGCSKMDRCRG